MRKTKSLLALLCAVVAAFVLAVPAFAVPTTYTITIEGEHATEGHTYEAYQVFQGEYYYDETLEEAKLSNIQWGSGVNGVAVLNALVADKTNFGNDFTAEMSAADVAEVLDTYANDAKKLQAFADVVAVHKATVTGTSSEERPPYTISELPAGYYLVQDKDSTVPGADAYTDYILQVLGNVTVDPKADIPTIKKQVKDIDDSTETAAGPWQDSADYDIGDDVPFLITATVADNYSRYDKYEFIIHDTASAGLTFNPDSVVVKVDGTTINPGQYTVETEGLGDGCTFEIRFVDLKQLQGATVQNNSVITVEYTAKLNENAVTASTGNDNKVKLEYSNNPNADGTGTTTEDVAVVFTYKTIINKKDDSTPANPLKGAAFKLEKKIAAAGAEEEPTWNLVKQFEPGDATRFEFTGLDDGVYRLSETVTPAGYNTMEDVVFTISATHDAESATPKVTALSGVDETGTISFTPNVNEGTLTADVVNKSGATLPSTGGIGTTIFYAVGATLVIGAGVVLVSRYRANHMK